MLGTSAALHKASGPKMSDHRTGSSRVLPSDQLRRSRLLTSVSPHSTTPAAPTSIQENAVQGVAARAPHAAVAVPTTRVAKSGLAYQKPMAGTPARGPKTQIGRASCRERE